MPKRFLKPGLTTSDRWNATKWVTQSFYVRLITLVDDYGRYDGRPAILRAHAFALRPEVTERVILELCEELTRSELAIFYKTGGKIVLQLTQWEEEPRSKAKYPAFDESCEQLFANASNCSASSSSSSYTPSSSPPTLAQSVGELIKSPSMAELALEIYELYPRKIAKQDGIKAIVAALKKVPSLELREKTERYAKAVEGMDIQFIPYPATWFNKGRYGDDPREWLNHGHNRNQQGVRDGRSTAAQRNSTIVGAERTAAEFIAEGYADENPPA